MPSSKVVIPKYTPMKTICKSLLSEKIRHNMKEGKYKTPQQAIAVAYSQVGKVCKLSEQK